MEARAYRDVCVFRFFLLSRLGASCGVVELLLAAAVWTFGADRLIKLGLFLSLQNNADRDSVLLRRVFLHQGLRYLRRR